MFVDYTYIYICINMYIHIIYICMYKYVYTYIYMYTVYIYIYGSPNGTKLSGENDRNSAVKHRSVHTVSICVLEPWILTLSWKKKWKNFHHVLMDQLPSFATNYYLDLPWICMYIYIFICIMCIHILWSFYHRWIVAIGLYIIYIYIYVLCYRVTPTYLHIYILCNYSIYNMLSGSPPYVYIYVYIYILSYRVTHTYTHIYIHTLNPTTLPLSHHSSNSRLLLLLLAAATPLKRWRRCRPQQTFQFVIYIYINLYIYIYQVYHLNGIYKIGGKYSHNIFEIYIPDLSYLDWW